MLGDHQKSIIRFYTIWFIKVLLPFSSSKLKKKREKKRKNKEEEKKCIKKRMVN